MASPERGTKRRNTERGSTLFILAASLFVLLGMGALAVDLASFYVARSQAQRAADAAALAGAKYFVESGCVTFGNCTGSEAIATARANVSAAQNLVNGQPVTITSVTYNETAQDPQITVNVTSSNFRLYFAGAVGITTSPTVGATATAEAWNPSGGVGSTTYCTSCQRPWLIPNCDQTVAVGPSGSNPMCTVTAPPLPATQAYLLTPGSYGVEDNGCTGSGGVVGEQVVLYLPTPTNPALPTPTTLYGALDVDNPGIGSLVDYQTAITTCFTGATTCGQPTLNVLPITAATANATVTGVENLLHVTATGLGAGQDYIDTTVCPPQIKAGAQDPLVTHGVVAQDSVIATSDSIVTAYVYDQFGVGYTGLTYTIVDGSDSPQTVNIVGFAQIFVSQVDANGNVYGNILSVAGCGNNPNAACGTGAGNTTSINSPTMLPVRLIKPTS